MRKIDLIDKEGQNYHLAVEDNGLICAIGYYNYLPNNKKHTSYYSYGRPENKFCWEKDTNHFHGPVLAKGSHVIGSVNSESLPTDPEVEKYLQESYTVEIIPNYHLITLNNFGVFIIDKIKSVEDNFKPNKELTTILKTP